MALHSGAPGVQGLKGPGHSGPCRNQPLNSSSRIEYDGGSHISAQPDAIEAAEIAAAAIDAKKGTDILLLDVSELVVVTDLFVIATGSSTRHVKTLVDDVEMALKAHDRRPLRREGEDYGKWVLLDYGDVVFHVFDRETRDFYELERLWADAPSLAFESTPAEAAVE